MARATEGLGAAAPIVQVRSLQIRREEDSAMDKRALIEALNNDLAGEFQAILAYTRWSAEVSGPHRDTLRAMFQREIPDELGHAQFLADKIVVYGGTPITTPAPVPEAPTNRAKLEAVLALEEQAIRNYSERAGQAEELGETALKVRLEEIVSDETTHYEEVKMLLRDWNETF
jgi:bacterioferritin